MGVDMYKSFIADGHSEYYGNDNQKIPSLPVHKTLMIAKKSSQDGLQEHVNFHKQGKNDCYE
ncbi:MAG: DUF1398 family protein [Ginsengibacter sp.]